MTVGSGAPTALMAGNIHGDETTGGQLLQRFLWETCFEPSRSISLLSFSLSPFLSPP
jgi:hypothetical protein